MKPIFKRSWISINCVSNDKWIGIYHRKRIVTDYLNTRSGETIKKEFHIWICIIPCFPVHIIKALKE